ncbi:MAG: HAD-IIIA family hydrolase [Vulcanimicrobiaceae bacterium]
MNDVSVAIVIPTIGRDSLGSLLVALEASDGPLPAEIVVVDDRPASEELPVPSLDRLGTRLQIVRSFGRGPAAARNAGWRATQAAWVAFLDDDVLVSPTWLRDMMVDLSACDERTAASQGRITVPLPADRAPTDWQRNVAGLENARWITADCAYRRAALASLDGFDERFPRAYREDADLALRAVERGWTIVQGARRAVHPVRPAGFWVSVRVQAGNADDALMRAIHGSGWYERAGAPRGTFASHARTVAAAAAAVLFAGTWLVRTASFAWARIAPGPRTYREVATMALTSALIPFAAVFHRLRGELRVRRVRSARTRLALFDRDGTLIEDVPNLRDPDDVRPVAGAREALARLRSAGIAVGVVTNQAALADGSVSEAELAAVHARLAERLGAFDVWAVCPHAVDAGCACRKPEAALVLRAARECGVPASACTVIGDIGSDVDAARAAGARAILVPTPLTLSAEIDRAPRVARDLAHAVDIVLAGSA